MKIITISKIGYNAPSQANWSYGVWKVDTINNDGNHPYCMSYTVKENFGGDSRLKQALESVNIPIIETKGVYTSTGTQKITGVGSLQDMDSKEFIGSLIEWYTNPKN